MNEPIDDLEKTHWQLVAGRRWLRALKHLTLAGLIVLTVVGLVGFWLQLGR